MQKIMELGSKFYFAFNFIGPTFFFKLNEQNRDVEERLHIQQLLYRDFGNFILQKITATARCNFAHVDAFHLETFEFGGSLIST